MRFTSATGKSEFPPLRLLRGIKAAPKIPDFRRSWANWTIAALGLPNLIRAVDVDLPVVLHCCVDHLPYLTAVDHVRRYRERIAVTEATFIALG
jgi:hypothetical protein